MYTLYQIIQHPRRFKHIPLKNVHQQKTMPLLMLGTFMKQILTLITVGPLTVCVNFVLLIIFPQSVRLTNFLPSAVTKVK